MNIDQYIQGTWLLTGCIGYGGGQAIYPLGESPVGQLCYCPPHMMVFISSQNRELFSTDDIRSIPPAEITADFPTYESYCGTYRIEGNTIHHDISISKVPNHIGQTFSRRIDLEGKKLTLSTIAPLTLNGIEFTFDLRWEKFNP